MELTSTHTNRKVHFVEGRDGGQMAVREYCLQNHHTFSFSFFINWVKWMLAAIDCPHRHGSRGWFVLASLIFMLQLVGGKMATAQPLSTFQDGRVLPFSHKNEFWLVFQDRQGFVWGYNKQNSIVRFDGKEIREFSHHPNDPSSLQCEGFPVFLEDSEGKIWIAIGGCGLDRYDPATERFDHYGPAVYAAYDGSPRAYHALFEDSRKDIWIGTQAGLFQYKRKQDSIVFVSNVYHCHSILEDKAGDVWAGTLYNKLIRRIDTTNSGKEKTINIPIQPQKRFASKSENVSLKTPGDQYLVKDIGFLYVFDALKEETHLAMAGLLEDERASYLFQDEGTILVGTNQGRILEFDPSTRTSSPFMTLPGQRNDKDAILRIFKTRDGLLWIVTQNKTYQVLPRNSPFRKKLFPGDSRPNPIALQHDLLVHYQGNVHFLVMDGLRPVIDGKAETFKLDFQESDFDVPNETLKKYPSAGAPSIVSGFKFAEDTLAGKLWLLLFQYPYGMKLISYDKQGKKTFKLYCEGRDTCFTDHYLDFKIDRKGRLMMAGWAGFSLYDPVTGRFLNFQRKEKFNDFATLTVLEDSKQQIWIGNNSRGVIRFHPETGQFAHFTHKPDNPATISSNNDIRNIIEDSSGKLWFTSLIGLNVYDPETGKFKRYYEKDGLPSNAVSAIIEDKNKHLWIATKYNLTRYDPTTETFFVFECKDGLPIAGFCDKGLMDNSTEDYFETKGAFSDRDNMLFFRTNEGVIFFHPDSVKIDNTVPKLVLTGLQLANHAVSPGDATGILSKSLAHTDKICMEYRQNVFSIRYAALEYFYTEKTTFAFQLEGFDDEWRHVGALREATYTNLSPDKYLFKVKCRNHHGFWGEPVTLHIHILPPWYRTWYAYLLYTLTALGLLYFLRRYELNRQLARAEARRLLELDHVKSRLYTNITHEFRTPLTVINGMADKLQGQVDFKAREGLSLIRRNGQQLLNLVNQILDLSKLESGTMPLNMVQADVVVFMKYLLESFHSLASTKNISLIFKASPEHFLMDFDAEKLRQIVSNLVQNAIKFTTNGGMITITCRADDAQFRMAIADNGRGIPADHLERIFDRFHQVDDSNTRRGEGTGIGLTLVREMVKLAGGQVSVESEPGKGTTFTVSLPVTRHAIAAPLDTPPWHSGANHENGNIQPSLDNALPSDQHPVLLLIEDNTDVVHYITLILQSHYQLRVASNGREGLEKALADLPDLILSDVMMPEMDGYEVCRQLKNNLATSHIPIVLLTAKADFDSRMEGLELGADAYLAKPFEEKELMIVLKKLHENRERVRQFYTSGTFLVGRETTHAQDSQLVSKDRTFVQRLVQTVEKNIGNPDFTAEALCSQMYLGYNTCLRKVKALTGMTINDYIHHIRLAHAARWLLEQPKRSVADIAASAGYKSQHHFNRVFKKMKGCSPSEYREAYPAHLSSTSKH